MIRALACGTLLVCLCAGQPFEKASVHPNQSGDRHTSYSISDGQDGAKLDAKNVSLQDVVQRAYNLSPHLVAGPDWLKDVKFDVIGELPEGEPKEKIGPALQALLGGRFKLACHRETREVPIYALTVAEGGPKIRSAADPNGTSGTWQNRGQYTAKNETLAHFSEAVSRQLGRPVIDMTGLAGVFDFTVDYEPDDASSLFKVLQEKVGLKLEARKAPVEMLIIDRVEKTPAEN